MPIRLLLRVGHRPGRGDGSGGRSGRPTRQADGATCRPHRADAPLDGASTATNKSTLAQVWNVSACPRCSARAAAAGQGAPPVRNARAPALQLGQALRDGHGAGGPQAGSLCHRPGWGIPWARPHSRVPAAGRRDTLGGAATATNNSTLAQVWNHSVGPRPSARAAAACAGASLKQCPSARRATASSAEARASCPLATGWKRAPHVRAGHCLCGIP